jgi:hypothetical protein
MRRLLALAVLGLACSTAPTVAFAGPPSLECTRSVMYAPEVEEAYRGLPPEVRAAVAHACGWD